MSLIQEIKKRIRPYMNTRGFRNRNRTYYYIQNDVAYCITFEQPSGLLYTWVHINPLYIPNNFISLTYGNRLSNVSGALLPPLEKNADSMEIDQWCDVFLSCVENVILPLFKQIDTPKKLAMFVEKSDREIVTGILCCPSVWIERLRMYTYLYLHDFQKTEVCIRCYQTEVSNSNFLTIALQNDKLAEAEMVQNVICSGEESVTDFCRQVISQSRQLFG